MRSCDCTRLLVANPDQLRTLAPMRVPRVVPMPLGVPGVLVPGVLVVVLQCSVVVVVVAQDVGEVGPQPPSVRAVGVLEQVPERVLRRRGRPVVVRLRQCLQREGGSGTRSR